MRTKDELKRYMIDIEYAYDNEYLDKYCELVCTTDTNPQTRHHIIPRHYYQDICVDVDNSVNNIANISFSNHVLAHYYLSLCCKGKYKYKNAYAFNLLNPSKNGFSVENLPEYDNIYKIFKEASSINHKGVPSWNKGKKDTHHKPMNEESRKKSSESKKGKYKGHKYVHLGDLERRVPIEEATLLVEQGWEWGRSPKSREALSKGAKAGWDRGTQKGMSGKTQSDTQRQAAKDANIGNQHAKGCKRSAETIQKRKDTLQRKKSNQ